MMKSIKKSSPVITKQDIACVLSEVGVKRSQHIMVHTSLNALGYICGGAQSIVEALIEAVGEDGSILMPSQSWKNLDPSTGVHWEISKEQWPLIRENWPAYDKTITPTNTMGAVAEMFRQWPGVVRSDHPARSVAAFGKERVFLTENHDLSNIFGIGSPMSKLYDLDGYVLLIGVGYDKCTSLHLADELATYPSKRTCVESSAINVCGKRQWVDYETLYVDGEDFEQIGRAFESVYSIPEISLGNGKVKLIHQRTLVNFAVQWIETNRV